MGRRLLDLSGKKFGKLTVLRYLFTNKKKKACWECICDCGDGVVVTGNHLKSGNTKSCGCFRSEKLKETNRLDLLGKKFGRLAVIADVGNDNNRNSLWKCRCDCGNITVVLANSLKNGHTKSCGCLKNEKSRFRSNLLNKKFGRLLVIEGLENSEYGRSLWRCVCDCSGEKIVSANRLLSEDTKSCGCLSKEMVGENSPHWKGGITSEPYCPIWLDPEFKQMILERDDYQCQNSDCWGTSKRLCGHHIDYNKKNCDLSNIITTCYSCNGRANKNRERWTKFYHEIMNEKQGHVYE